MITIKDVARYAGVSHSTVSRVMTQNVPVAQETREKVLAAVEALRYKPNTIAKALKVGKTRTLALILPQIDWTIFPQIARGVETQARNRGYMVILCDTHESREIERDYIDRLKERSVDGFIVCSCSGDPSIVLRLREEMIPVVVLLRGLLDVPVDMVIAENFTASIAATQHLVDRGCRRIAFVNHDTRILSYHERFHGYKKALENNAIPFDKAIVAQQVDLGYAGSRDAVERFFAAGHRFDGIFCASDAAAAGALQAISAHGLRVPEDIKVMGFGGIDSAKMVQPSLTTMVQQSTHMGERAADRLIDIIERGVGGEPFVERFEPRLFQGQST